MNIKRKVLRNLMIFYLILMPIRFKATRVEAAPDVNTEDTGTEITTEEE